MATILTGCDCSISEDTARSWQQRLSAGLVPGHRDFKALQCNADIGWSLFSYRLPPDVDPAGVALTLRTQIALSAPPMFAVEPSGSPRGCWSPVLETATELQMQCQTVTYGSPGHDEWRFLIDPARRRVTGMYSNLDSPAEREQYAWLLAAFRDAHAKN
ncbi:MAG: hypothetical protein ABW221_01375 [Vicinamibacteria bacterium]